MKYTSVVRAEFIDRPNRFVAHVRLGDTVETVHVKNTGRCRELLLPGAEVILAEGNNPSRKTRYDLITVWKEGLGWVNIDSQVPNAAVKEWLERQGYELIHPEYRYGDSRFDFYMEKNGQRFLLEVKGCTLEREGIGFFPDAPTLRGTKHLKELTAALKEGYHCAVAFVIAMPGVAEVRPNQETDPSFSAALEEAKRAGVEILQLPCRVTENEISII